MGCGETVSLWHDEWLDSRVLKFQYPQIYAITRHKEVMVQEFFHVLPGTRAWFVEVIRNVND